MRPRARMRWRVAAGGLDLGGFFVTLFIGGMLYVFYGALEASIAAYKAAYYPTAFLPDAWNAWAYGWAAIPVIILVSAVVGLLLAAQKSRQQGAVRL